jgi:hypothetical protein
MGGLKPTPTNPRCFSETQSQGFALGCFRGLPPGGRLRRTARDNCDALFDWLLTVIERGESFQSRHGEVH